LLVPVHEGRIVYQFIVLLFEMLSMVTCISLLQAWSRSTGTTTLLQLDVAWRALVKWMWGGMAGAMSASACLMLKPQISKLQAKKNDEIAVLKNKNTGFLSSELIHQHKAITSSLRDIMSALLRAGRMKPPPRSAGRNDGNRFGKSFL
jgi:hypothetical protein